MRSLLSLGFPCCVLLAAIAPSARAQADGEPQPPSAGEMAKLIEQAQRFTPRARGQALYALRKAGPTALPAVPTLARLLHHEEPDTAMQAALALGAIGGPAGDVLMKALGSDDARLQKLAVYGFASGEGPPPPVSALPRLRALLKSDDRHLVAAAARCIGRLSPARAEAAADLVRELRRGPTLTRMAIAGALGRQGPPAVPGLISCLSDETLEVRTFACTALARLGPAARPALLALKRLFLDSDPPSVEAAGALASIGAEGVAVLKETLESGAGTQRAAAAYALRHAPQGSGAVDLLVGLLGHEDGNVRKEAALALGALGDRAKGAAAAIFSMGMAHPEQKRAAVFGLSGLGVHAAPLVLDRFASGDEVEQRLAMACLRHLGKHAAPALPRLEALLEGEDAMERELSLSVLCGVGHAVPAAARPLGRALAIEPRPEMRETILSALASMGENAGPAFPAAFVLYATDPPRGQAIALKRVLLTGGKQALPVLRGNLAGGVRKHRLAALEVAAMIGKPLSPLAPAVGALLANEDPEIRRAAARSVGALEEGALPFLPRLIEMLGDADLDTAMAAAHGLSRMGPRAVGPLMKIFDDGDFRTMKLAGHALVLMGGDAVPAILEGLAVDDRGLRLVMDETRRLMPSARNPLIAALSHDRPRVRLEAARLLARSFFQDADTVEALVEALAAQPEESWRDMAFSVARTGKGAALPLFDMARRSEEAQRRAGFILDRIEGGTVDACRIVLRSGTTPDRDLALSHLRFLGKAASPAHAEVLPCLEDPDVALRRKAAAVLGASGNKQAVPHLVRALQGPLTSDEAARALGKLTGQELGKAEAWWEWWTQSHPDAGPLPVPLVDPFEEAVAGLVHADRDVRLRAVHHLEQAGDPLAVAPLLTAHQTAGRQGVMIHLIERAVKACAHGRNLPELVAALGPEHDPERWLFPLLKTLSGETGLPDEVAAWTAWLRDIYPRLIGPDGDIDPARRSGVELGRLERALFEDRMTGRDMDALARRGDDAAPLLLRALTEGTPSTQSSAMAVIRRMGPDRLASKLAPLLSSRAPLACDVAVLLGRVDTLPVRAAFAEALAGGDMPLKRLAFEYLEGKRDELAAKALSIALFDGPPRWRCRVARALGNHPRAVSRAALAEALRIEIDAVRTEALASLGRIGTPADLEVLFTVVQEGNPLLFHQAVDGLYAVVAGHEAEIGGAGESGGQTEHGPLLSFIRLWAECGGDEATFREQAASRYLKPGPGTTGAWARGLDLIDHALPHVVDPGSSLDTRLKAMAWIADGDAAAIHRCAAKACLRWSPRSRFRAAEILAARGRFQAASLWISLLDVREGDWADRAYRRLDRACGGAGPSGRSCRAWTDWVGTIPAKSLPGLAQLSRAVKARRERTLRVNWEAIPLFEVAEVYRRLDWGRIRFTGSVDRGRRVTIKTTGAPAHLVMRSVADQLGLSLRARGRAWILGPAREVEALSAADPLLRPNHPQFAPRNAHLGLALETRQIEIEGPSRPATAYVDHVVQLADGDLVFATGDGLAPSALEDAFRLHCAATPLERVLSLLLSRAGLCYRLRWGRIIVGEAKAVEDLCRGAEVLDPGAPGGLWRAAAEHRIDVDVRDKPLGMVLDYMLGKMGLALDRNASDPDMWRRPVSGRYEGQPATYTINHLLWKAGADLAFKPDTAAKTLVIVARP